MERGLQKRIELLEERMDAELRKAQAAMQRKPINKSAAVQSMKLRKMLEAEKKSLEGQLSRVQQTIMALESVSRQQLFVAAQQAGAAALKANMAVAGPDKVADVMDDLDDVTAQVHEVQERLGQSTGDQDDEELLAELGALSVEEDELAALQAEPALPSVPTKAPVLKPAQPAGRAAAAKGTTAEEDAEFEALQAEFS